MFDGRLNLQSLQTRSLSAAIIIPIVLLVLYFGGWPFILLLTLLGGVSLYEWGNASFACPKPQQYYYLGFGVLYVVAAFSCCYFIFEQLGFYWAMAFLFMVWSSDSGAYFMGKFIGGAKMAEKISPNKTWAGFGGALISPAIIGIVAVFLYKGVDGFTFIEASILALIGIVIGVTGQAGDLLVSSLKRQANIKDTGSIIPGHGGVLDRIDSMLLAAPFYLFLMVTFYVTA